MYLFYSVIIKILFDTREKNDQIFIFYVKFYLFVHSNNDRKYNYIYQVLMQCGEGELLIKAYDFEEKLKKNKQRVEIGKPLHFPFATLRELFYLMK